MPMDITPEMTAENRPAPDPTISLEEARRIANRFDLPDSLRVYDFAGKGNINRNTFLAAARSPGRTREYLLQMLNTDVFPCPERVMDTWITCVRAQQHALQDGVLGRESGWELIRLVPTREGNPYLRIDDAADRPQYWRVMTRIPRACSYKSLSEIDSHARRLEIAAQAGRGLAIFQRLTAEINPDDLHEPLPGYRNTALYYAQLESVLENARTVEEASGFLPPEPHLRRRTEKHFLVRLDPGKYRRRMAEKEVRRLVSLAMDNRAYGLRLHQGLQSGSLKKTVVHGDTKLENFLFNMRTGRVTALVDLDTVMAHTWLSDWGDMARSLTRVSGEALPEGRAAETSPDIYRALAHGFLESAPHIPKKETAFMADAARIMALELGVRFLTDYLRGDTYFRPGPDAPEDLNRIRATVQFSVFRDLGGMADEAKQCLQTP